MGEVECFSDEEKVTLQVSGRILFVDQWDKKSCVFNASSVKKTYKTAQCMLELPNGSLAMLVRYGADVGRSRLVFYSSGLIVVFSNIVLIHHLFLNNFCRPIDLAAIISFGFQLID